jgi:hypothetical protein
MMLDWNEYRKQLALGVKEIGQLSRDTIKGYIELSSAGQKKNLLGAKTRELIADFTLRRLHYGSYRGSDQERCNRGGDRGSARRRNSSQCRGSARVLRAGNGRVQGISGSRRVEGVRHGAERSRDFGRGCA